MRGNGWKRKLPAAGKPGGGCPHIEEVPRLCKEIAGRFVIFIQKISRRDEIDRLLRLYRRQAKGPETSKGDE